MTPVRLAIRGFAGKVLQFEDLVTVDASSLDTLLPALAEKHALQLVAHELHMIEIEFLEEPNVEERFFRFGSDASGMVMPLRIRW